MTFENRYSLVEQWLHRLAFSTTGIQLELDELETRLYRDDLAGCRVDRPVFITSLPRAGTTLILDLIAGLDGWATHRYRDMPFVLLPLLWASFSGRFHKTDTPRERAHGDGMLVSVDSPEAFEEMIWRALCPEQYAADRILPWPAESSAGQAGYFQGHIRKVVALARKHAGRMPRYVSKNNFNIARIRWLSHACHSAQFVVPFRDPLQHAASLLNQHRHFLKIHRQDAFARRYMLGVGHLDFGANHRPVDFGGWLARSSHRDAEGLAYWLEYWIAAYSDLLNIDSGRICFLSFESVCSKPESALTTLADVLAIGDARALLARAKDIRGVKPHEISLGEVDDGLLKESTAVFERLLSRAMPK